MKKYLLFIPVFLCFCSFFACDKSCEHEYTFEYVCEKCGAPNECTLEIIGNDFEEDILRQARKNAGNLVGNFEIVILDKEATIENLQNYVISADLNLEEIERGLFVKLDFVAGEDGMPVTLYYNFGLELNSAQEKDIAVSYDGSDESWLLEPVKGNNKILFEYSIVEKGH